MASGVISTSNRSPASMPSDFLAWLGTTIWCLVLTFTLSIPKMLSGSLRLDNGRSSAGRVTAGEARWGDGKRVRTAYAPNALGPGSALVGGHHRPGLLVQVLPRGERGADHARVHGLHLRIPPGCHEPVQSSAAADRCQGWRPGRRLDAPGASGSMAPRSPASVASPDVDDLAADQAQRITQRLGDDHSAAMVDDRHSLRMMPTSRTVVISRRRAAASNRGRTRRYSGSSGRMRAQPARLAPRRADRQPKGAGSGGAIDIIRRTDLPGVQALLAH